MKSFTGKSQTNTASALLIIVLVLSLRTSLTAQEGFKAMFQQSSIITIYGTTNINDFKLTITGQGIPAKSYNGIFIKKEGIIVLESDSIAIPVRNFKSRDPLAYSGFLKLVNEKKHPKIYLKPNYIQIPFSELTKRTQTITANGNITIAGVTKSYMFPLKVTSNESRGYNISGRIRITIRDFGLEPPVEFFGLVKISEWVEIDFNTYILISL